MTFLAGHPLPDQWEEKQKGGECWIERYLFIIKIIWRFILSFLCVYIDVFFFQLLFFSITRLLVLTSVIFLDTDNKLSRLN